MAPARRAAARWRCAAMLGGAGRWVRWWWGDRGWWLNGLGLVSTGAIDQVALGIPVPRNWCELLGDVRERLARDPPAIWLARERAIWSSNRLMMKIIGQHPSEDMLLSAAMPQSTALRQIGLVDDIVEKPEERSGISGVAREPPGWWCCCFCCGGCASCYVKLNEDVVVSQKRGAPPNHSCIHIHNLHIVMNKPVWGYPQLLRNHPAMVEPSQINGKPPYKQSKPEILIKFGRPSLSFVDATGWKGHTCTYLDGYCTNGLYKFLVR
eukprot:Skav234906  [mRNA]  locus=scaffold840:789996:793542:+ [translate_table: standard]